MPGFRETELEKIQYFQNGEMITKKKLERKDKASHNFCKKKMEDKKDSYTASRSFVGLQFSYFLVQKSFSS